MKEKNLKNILGQEWCIICGGLHFIITKDIIFRYCKCLRKIPKSELIRLSKGKSKNGIDFF